MPGREVAFWETVRVTAYLYNLDEFSVAAVFAGVMLVLSLVAPFVGKRLGWNADTKEKADFVGRAQSTVLSFGALALSFSLVQVQGNFRQTEQIVHKEASTVLLLEHQLLRFGLPAANIPRTLLRGYASSIIHDEWPSMQHHDVSNKTTAAFRALSDGVGDLQPSPGRQQMAYADIIKSLDNLFETRGLRRAAAATALSSTFWILAFVLLAILVGLNLMVVPLPTNLVSVVAPCVALALLASVVFVTDRPFIGRAGILPTSLEYVLIEMNTSGQP